MQLSFGLIIIDNVIINLTFINRKKMNADDNYEAKFLMESEGKIRLNYEN